MVLELAKVAKSFRKHCFLEILMVLAVRKANHLPAGKSRTALSELGRGRDKENDGRSKKEWFFNLTALL